ncbi:hypothetical protein ACVWWR_007363 [Bradyrhizobium sp. LM3.2]
MRGAEPLALHEGERVGADALCFVRHRLMVGSDHDRERGTGSLGCGGEHVGEQALVRDRMQHFRQARSHACAFAGGEHDREAGTGGHRKSCQIRPNQLAAAGRCRHELSPCYPRNRPEFKCDKVFLLMFPD